MWRQGDVLIEKIDSIPLGLDPIKRLVLAESASSGKSHKIKNPRSARLFGRMERQSTSELFLEVVHESAELIHSEHGTIQLPRGCFRVWRQREFSDLGPRSMID